MYLDGNGAELATRGEVGVLSLVTDGDLVVGVDDVATTTVLFVTVGELKSNDKRDLRTQMKRHVVMTNEMGGWMDDDSYLGELTTVVE